MANIYLSSQSGLSVIGTSNNDIFFGDLDSTGPDFVVGQDWFIDGGAGQDLFAEDSPFNHFILDLDAGIGVGFPLDIDPDTWSPSAADLFTYNFKDIEKFSVNNHKGRTILRGDSDENFLEVYVGSALVEGRGGNDSLGAYRGGIHLDGGEGDDSLYASTSTSRSDEPVSLSGGTGFDVVTTSNNARLGGIDPNAFSVALFDGGLKITSDDNQFLIYDDVEELQIGNGSRSDPMAVTFTYAQLEALAPLPILGTTGTDGSDRLQGTNAPEIMRGLGGNDIIVGSFGADTLDGGAGTDHVTYAELDFGASTGTTGITGRPVDLSSNPYTLEIDVQSPGLGGTTSTQTLLSIERLTGTSKNDTFYGTIGRDVQRGLGGNDVFVSSPGADSYVGGAGSEDTLVVRHSSEGSLISLHLGRGYGDEAEGDTYSGIEVVRTDNAFGTTDMQFVGDASDNLLEGGAGNDTLRGLNGDDTLIGNDGIDTAIFDFQYREAIINAHSGVLGSTGQSGGLAVAVQHFYSGFGFGRDIVDGVEFLQFTDGIFNTASWTFAPAAPNYIPGTVGDDVIFGSNSPDLINAFAGDDLIYTSAGADRIDGGAGRDWLRDLSGTTADAHLSLFAGRGYSGNFAGDQIAGIEKVTTLYGDDRIIGDHGNNAIYSGHGDDVIRALAGNDYIQAGHGNDTVIFDFDRDQYEIRANNAISVIVNYIGNGTGDGTNIVAHAEVLQFADGDFLL